MRHHVRTAAATLLSAAAALAGTLVATAPAASVAGPEYVALGDSYASGTGTRSYVAGGTSCQRSTTPYPSLIATAKGLTLRFQACSGARVPDVRLQLGALSTATTYVTVSVGGNDAGFSDVVRECATPYWAGDCDAAVDRAQAYISGTLPASLSSLYSAIRSKAPNARVVVVGYPRLFMGEDCNAGTWFSPAEMTRLNATADQLNSVTSRAASGAGFRFANPTTAFTGHAVCDDVEWLNGLSDPTSESYHPNRSGHSRGYAPLVTPALTGSAY